jgi:hypothetical protein
MIIKGSEHSPRQEAIDLGAAAASCGRLPFRHSRLWILPPASALLRECLPMHAPIKAGAWKSATAHTQVVAKAKICGR